MINLEMLERAAQVAFLLFKIIGCFTGSFLCLYLIQKIVFNGIGFVIRIRPPQEFDDNFDENDEDSK